MLPTDLRPEEHGQPHNVTFNIQFRYCDERDYRLYACGVVSLSDLRSLVSELVVLSRVEHIRVTYDTCYTEYKQFCP